MDLKYYSQSYYLQKNASVKPRIDFEIVLRRFGAKPVGLKSHIFVKRIAYRFYAIINYIISWVTMPKNCLIFFQYPYQVGIRSIFYRALKKRNYTCLLVHDLDELRPINYDPFSDLLEHADYLIVHTTAMKEWLNEKHNIKGKTYILNLFDYIHTSKETNKHSKLHTPIKVAFCGNLQKSQFLKKLTIPKGITLAIYGEPCSQEILDNPNFDYRGVADPEILPDLIGDCDYGLVWDGQDETKMSDLQGSYLRYNAPHKVSLYLAAGLPVLLWEKMGICEFITNNGIGITANSVVQLFNKIKELSSDEAMLQKHKAEIIKHKICKGDMFENIIRQVISTHYS